MKYLLLLLFFVSNLAAAQVDVPIIVPYEPGGTTDRIARFMTKHLSNKDYNFIVKYKPGAGGLLGSNYLATVNSTHLLIASNNLLVAPVFNTVTYDVNKFVPISLVGTAPTIIVSNAQSNLRELSQLNSQQSYSFASAGVGTSGHLTMLALNKQNNLVHVPYKGGAQVVLALLNNDVNVTIETTSSLAQHIDSGKIRPIAVVNSKRLPKFPEVKTLKEHGFDDTGIARWFGVIASENSNPEIIKYVRTMMQDEKLLADLETLEINMSSKVKFSEFIKAETKKIIELHRGMK
jgi:tripartite-type tricarboxylate transporter receptor subunit TctC